MDAASMPPSPQAIMKHSFIYSLLIAILITLSFLNMGVQHKSIQDSNQIELQNFVNKRDSMLRDAYEYIKELEIRQDPETLWLARAVYSETDDSLEQTYVAQVIRNRVDIRFEGDSTFKDVILKPYQFSAFNPGYERKWMIMNLSITDVNNKIFMNAYEVSVNTRMMDSTEFKGTHFYSPISMEPPFSRPQFSYIIPRLETGEIDKSRFRFFSIL